MISRSIEFEFFRLGVDLHFEPRCRLVHEVDRLVWQKTFGDVAVRERRRRDQRAVGDAHTVMCLVFVLEPAQDRDRVLDGRLADIDRLETAGERRILLDMLSVFVERSGANAMQFAASQRWLEQVRRVHRAVGLARADDRVHLVDEKNVGAGRRRYFLQHGLEPFLEFAAIFCAGDERAHVQRKELLVLEAFRHIAVDDAQREPLDDGGLSDARLADQHRIVLGPPREHLNRAADFLIAPDHRVEFAVASSLGEVARIFLQRVVGVFRRSTVGGTALAQRLDGGVDVLRGHAGIGEDFAGFGPFLQRERKQQPLDGDETISGFLARLLGHIEDPRQRGIEIDLAGASARDFGAFGECRLDGGQGLARIAARTVNEACGEPFGIVEQDLEQVLGRELLMPLAQRERLGGLDEALGAVGVFVEIHDLFPRPVPNARGAVGTSSLG